MSFQTVPVNVTGPSYQDRSRPLSSQVTRHFYQELNDASTNQYTLKSFPGQTLFGSTVSGVDRGATEMAEVGYRVVGFNLIEIAIDGTHTTKGTIPGRERCIFANDGSDLFIVSEKRVFKYDGSAVTEVLDSNITGSKSVTYINDQFIYTQDTQSVVSDVGDGSAASGLNAIGADSKPDNMVRDYVFDQIIYRFGQRSIESWYNSGVGSPPIDRIEGQFFNVGLGAIHSVNNTQNFIYWLGSDKRVYRARGGQDEPISSKAISHAIEGYSTIDDAYGEVLTFEGQVFYVLNFPSEDKTWAVNEELGNDGWFELSANTNGGAYNAGSIVSVYDKVLIGHCSNGKTLELDINSFDLNGEVLQRRRVLAPITGEKIGARGKRVQMSRFELIMEKGVGLITGQGEDPKIMLEASYDGGNSWSTGTWMKIGRQGEFLIRAEWFSLRSFYELMIRLTTSDAVPINIYSGTIDLRIAGR